MILLVASLPILISAGALLFFRQSAARAGVLGLGVAILVAFLVGPFRLAPAAVGGAVLEGSLTTLIVAYVLLGGVLLYHVMRLGGALEALSAATARAIPDPAHRLLTLVFGVSVFFESATGFGIGIVVCAPLFLALGFAPLRAAFLALLGQCAVPWGALAIGTTLGSELSGVESAALGIWGALFSLPFILLCGAVALAVGGLWKPVGKRLLQLLVYTFLLVLVLAGSSRWLGVELAGILGGLAVLGLGLLAGRRAGQAQEGGRQEERLPGPLLGRALTPVVVLVGGLLLTRLLPSLKAWSQGHLVLEVPRFDYALPLLYHPGFWMVLGALAGVVALPLALRQLPGALSQAGRQWITATLAVAGFLCMAQVMYDAGMVTTLAQQVTAALAEDFVLLAPFIGALGGFLTASNAGANAMFMQFQASSAEALKLPLEPVAAAQNAAAANATLASPGRVVLAALVTHCGGQEGQLMRRGLLLVLAGTLFMSLLLLPLR